MRPILLIMWTPFQSFILRHNNNNKEVPPWYSSVMPKPAYQNTTSEAFWDISIYAEHNKVRANRIDGDLSATRGKKSAQLK